MTKNRHESYFDSSNTLKMFRSGWGTLQARRMRTIDQISQHRFYPRDFLAWFVYTALIIIPGIFLELYQQLHLMLTGRPRKHPEGSWQYYLYSGLREDTAHHTNETIGYFRDRPEDASDLDDLTAWVMATIQFVWNYDEILGVIWDEWTYLGLLKNAAEESGIQSDDKFIRLQRQWELMRPYEAPLNGSYADIRKGKFEEFFNERASLLPVQTRARMQAKYQEKARIEREAFKRQLSLLRKITSGRFIDHCEGIPLWEAHIAVVFQGCYALVPVAARNAAGDVLMITARGSVPIRADSGCLQTFEGEKLAVKGDQLFASQDGSYVGYLDMAPAANIKYQLERILANPGPSRRKTSLDEGTAVDILLAETPRPSQRKLRSLLPDKTRLEIDRLRNAPLVINWELRNSDLTLSEIRRTYRGIGDHALTLLRTEDSIIFDQSHIFFDGAWSLAIAEILTSAAVNWCRRVITITASRTCEPIFLSLTPTETFAAEAKIRQNIPEISSETTIFDISQIFKLRKMLREDFQTELTINDLLVTTRILHAVNYTPSLALEESLHTFREQALGASERHASRLIERSLRRGRQTNPALLIPVDASPINPADRIYPIAFRIPSDDLLWKWDAAWEAYQQYRRHDPPNTPEGLKSYASFDERRKDLVAELYEYSRVLDAAKAVALRAESFNLAILRLMPHLHPAVQTAIKGIAEAFPLVNELARGDEVYSNVGRVAVGSSITRFMSAKDDGKTKFHVWGILTDDEGQMVVTMRDFRPHVSALQRTGHTDLAYALAHDYVVSYTNSLIGLVARLWAMLQAVKPQ